MRSVPEAAAYQQQRLGRISAQFKGAVRILAPTGSCLAKPSGRLIYRAQRRDELPAVGDWVVYRQEGSDSNGFVEEILPRKSKFSRKEAGDITEEQIVAANIDTVFVVMSLNRDFNVRRLERYLVAAWESGADPVLVLTKADLCEDVESCLRDAAGVAAGVPLLVTSSVTGEGLQELAVHCTLGKTAALLGSSGAGKSTLINHLLGNDQQRVQEIRADDQRGRHTTTHRELFIMEDGGILVDTPGMRELQLWDSDHGLDTAFQDVEALAAQCQFADCQHASEPHCAVKQALADGTLAEERFASYQKLQAELAYLKRKEDVRAMQANKQFWKQVAKSGAAHKRQRY